MSLTGIQPIHSEWPGRYAYLGHEDDTTWRHTLILHRVKGPKPPVPNRARITIDVDDLARAVHRLGLIGGWLPASDNADYPDHLSGAQSGTTGWAELCDPFGNEFWLRGGTHAHTHL